LRQQFAVFFAHNKELCTTAHEVATRAAEPIKAGMSKAFNKASGIAAPQQAAFKMTIGLPIRQTFDESFRRIPMKFRPVHDRVVVERIDAEAKTAGGIIIPDTAQEKPQQGKIIAVGPGGRDESGKLIPIDVKVGDRILFGKWSGTEVKIDGVEYLIMKESDIMGVLIEAEAKKKAA
jgi:chaperonin GroES